MRPLRRSSPTAIMMDCFGAHCTHAADLTATSASVGSVVPGISAVPITIRLAGDVAIAPRRGCKRTNARRRDAGATVEIDRVGLCRGVDDDAVPRMRIFTRHRG